FVGEGGAAGGGAVGIGDDDFGRAGHAGGGDGFEFAFGEHFHRARAGAADGHAGGGNEARAFDRHGGAARGGARVGGVVGDRGRRAFTHEKRGPCFRVLEGVARFAFTVFDDRAERPRAGVCFDDVEAVARFWFKAIAGCDL